MTHQHLRINLNLNSPTNPPEFNSKEIRQAVCISFWESTYGTRKDCSQCGKANRGYKITDAITGPPEVPAFFYKELNSLSANWTLLVIILQLTHSKNTLQLGA